MKDVLYARIASEAVKHPSFATDPLKAWVETAAKIAKSPHSRDKGCPRSTFISLVKNGCLKGVSDTLGQKSLSKNAEYALAAKKIYDEHKNSAELLEDKKAWWELVRQRCGIERKNQNGVLDVVIGLIEARAFKA